MARRSQCSESGDNPLDPNYLPPHYREEYRLAIDALIEEDVDGYYKFLQFADVVDFLAPSEIEYIQTSIQLPKQSAHPEHRYFDPTADGSSDTYWPMHSDLDAPGLDLGWPQIHHFIGPTEVTTLVNPAAPDMPSIKEQARRLIKSAQMVIAVVMDVFTDVDIFADILNAARRNVAVYLLLDEANVQHFINMVNNCRVNLEAIQFLRVRTVTGISYHCRTGKSFKGQMLDRFILTDCRAVLSGNYSFMWSYEKLHRCMAHLFLGQLVSTFDEEFRILFAQSEPLDLQKMEDLTVLPKRSYLGERPMLRGKYTPAQPEEWNRPTYEENVDWKMAPVKRQEAFHGPLDIYNRYPSPHSRLDPQTRLEPPFDQGPPRIMEGLAHKRHSFGEGGPGRYGLPYQQPGLPEVEPPGRQFYRGQQHLHPGHEPDYGGYGQTDKFWNQEFPQEEPHPDQGYTQEMDPQNFDPVLNYLSSTRNVDIEQSSDKLIPGPDLPYATTHSRRHIGQPYACQTSPTPSNTTEKKFMPDYSSDRKDPTVKKGLRNWRISSYLSAYDDSGEPEGLPMGQNVDPFDDFPNPIQQPTPPPPQAVDLAVSKIPNVREYKVPALPRASQMPAYGNTTQRNVPKKIPDEIPQIMVVPEPKAPTPTPSESSDGEKQEETEPREPIVPVLKRDDSFRGKYNTAGLGISRLRSSLIFKSLDQNTAQDNSEQDADKTKTETDQTKLPFGSQRRSGAREPFKWRSYIKPSDNAKTEEDTGKQAEKDTESKLGGLLESKESAKSTETKTKEVAKSPNVAPKIDKVEVAPLPTTQIEQPKIEQPPVQQPSASVLSEPIFDMNDPDQRFLFFKELAAKRRAEKAAEEAKLKQKSAAKEKKDEPEKEKQVQKDVSGSTSETTKEESKKIEGKTLDLSGKIKKVDCGVKEGPTSTQSGEKLETKVVTDSEKIKSKLSQPSQPASTGELAQKNQDPREIDAPECIGKQDKPKEANKASMPVDVKQVTVENQPNTTTDATSKEPQLKSSSSVPDFSKTKGLDLLSSRIYERSHLQEASKEATPKSRLWTPSIHRREFLKPFGDKQKSSSTVDQIEERTEEPSSASEASKNQDKVVKFEIDDKTEINQASKQSAKSISENKQPQKNKTIEKSDSSGVEKTKDAKEVSLSQSLRSTATEKPTTTISGKVKESTKESIKIEESVLSTAVKESTGPCQSLASVESGKQETVSTILDPKQTQMTKKDESSVKPSDTEIKVGTEKPSLSQSKPKTEQKHPVDPSGNDKSNAEQVEDNAQRSEKVSPQQQDKMAEKSTIDTQQSTKVAGTKEVAQTIEKPDEFLSTSEKVTPTKSNVETIDKNAQVATSRGKDDTKEVDSVEKKSSIATQEVVEASKDKTDTVPLYIDDSKPKYSITYIEEVPQLESHSNTSSPASFATALEFISSEDSDILSPKNLFKSGPLESSVSDMSDFETPNSEISMSPMPSALDMDDTFEDNVSIAETVIEAASRRKASATEEVKGTKEGGADISKSKQIESQQERQYTESLNSATAQSEAKRQDQVGITQLAKAAEVTESSAVLKDSVASPASSEEKNETKMEDKPAQKAVDVKSLDPKVSVIKSDAETSSTKQSTTSPGTNVTKDVTTGGKVSEISSKGNEVSKVSTSESSKHETKPIKVYSRFQIEPSTASSETKTSTVIPPAAEVKIRDQTSEIKEQSESITEETCSEGVGPNVQESQSKTKPAESNLNELSTMETKASLATVEAKTVDKTSEIITHETSAASENLVHKKDVSKTDVLSNASEVNHSPTSPITSKATKEPETLENAAKTTEDTCKPSETANIDCQKDVSNETAPKGEKNESTTDISSSASETNQSTTSSATSEMTTEAKTSDKESNIVSIDISKSAAGGENEQTGKDTNDNTKENTESAKVIETAPSAAQPKQSKSRYLTSTANVISSSNLRDDTKILLEQISANSQTRNESNPAKEAPVTDDEKEDKADKNAKRNNDLRSSLGPQKSNQERDKLLERIQTMRKDRKVYSRFEV